MTEEITAHLQAMERTDAMNDMRNMRLHLTILERSVMYMDQDQHRRYREQCERMQQAMRVRFGAAMGS